MKHKLRILSLEDNEDDSELARVRLLREGIECDLVRVEMRDHFIAEIERGGFDLILADYSLPSFDGLSALDIAKQKCPGVPFIFLSGAVGEEFAIETIRRGATDYVLKGGLSRLPVTIRRALLEVEEHTKLRQTENELEQYRQRLEEMVRERTAELKKMNEQLQLELVARKKLEKQMRAASITDELTGLLNRRGFLIFAERQRDIAKRNKKNFSLLYLDLDEMKRINDEFGHREGDRALVDISSILKKTFRASDIIARIGGDEFAVLITEPRASIEKTIAGHIQDNLRIHNEQTKKGYRLSLSMGMVHYDAEHPCYVEELLDKADALMYAHKRQRGLERDTIPSETGGKKDERVCERYHASASLPAEITVSGSAVIKNISASGVALRTSQRLTKSTIYKITLRFAEGEELSCQAVVVWSSLMGKVTEEDDGGPYYEAGLKFIEPNNKFIRSLDNLIYRILTPSCLWERMEDSDGWTSTDH
jgi:two-component system cell cycle response regulator